MSKPSILRRTLRLIPIVTIACGGLGAAQAAPPFLPKMINSSAIPANGDQNPYGVAFVPQAFRPTAPIKPGDVLVSNFNNSSNASPGNIQGTGTTIVQLHPNGGQRPRERPRSSSPETARSGYRVGRRARRLCVRRERTDQGRHLCDHWAGCSAGDRPQRPLGSRPGPTRPFSTDRGTWPWMTRATSCTSSSPMCSMARSRGSTSASLSQRSSCSTRP